MQSTRQHATPQARVRSLNRGLALAMVARRSAASRADLADAIGLTRPAVSRIVADLSTAGLLTEDDPRPTGGRGRPTALLRLRRGAHVLVAVEIRLEGIRIQMRDLAGNLWSESSHALPIAATPQHAMRIIGHELDTIMAAHHRRPDGIGIAVGALVDERHGIIVSSPYRPWRNVPLSRMIADAAGVPESAITMRDVGSAAALGNWYELARDEDLTDLVHLQIGIGGGTGIARQRGGLPVLDRATRMAHVPLEPNGLRCACGARGCFDAMAGFWALVARSEGTGLVPQEGPQMIETFCAQVRALADDGDPVAVRAIEEMAGWFARAAAIAFNTLRPTRFTYGGYPILLGPRFHRQFLSVLRPYVDVDLDSAIAVTTLGDRASIHGAYRLAAEHVITGPHLA